MVREAGDVDVVVVDARVGPHHRTRLQIVQPGVVGVARDEHVLWLDGLVHEWMGGELGRGGVEVRCARASNQTVATSFHILSTWSSQFPWMDVSLGKVS